MIQQELSQEKFSVKHTSGERKVYDELTEAFEKSDLDLALRLQGFARHVKRQDVARFLVRYVKYPGETTAMLEVVGMPALRRLPYDPMISYFVKE